MDTNDLSITNCKVLGLASLFLDHPCSKTDQISFTTVKSATFTFVKSSLNFTHGFPPMEDNLITIFKALLISPDEATLKSFVRKVPIPNETDRDISDPFLVCCQYF